MPVITRSNSSVIPTTPITPITPITKFKLNTNNLRRATPVDYVEINSDNGEKEKKIKKEKEEKEEKEEEEKENFPAATLATSLDLERLNLTPNSLDPSGKYHIIAKATELEYIYVCQMSSELQGKWAIAPPGYYWIYLSEKCYYWFEWYELRRIPV